MARKADQIASLFAAVGFKIDRAGLKEVDVALGRVEKRLAGIVKSFQGMSGSKSLTGALRATAKDSGKAAAGIDVITARLKAGIPALNTYTQQMRVLAAELRSVTGARPNLPRVPSGSNRGTSGGGASPYSNQRASGVFGGMSRALFGGGASGVLRGLFPGIGLAYGAMNIVQGGREVMATENALSAITGSQAQGKAELEYTKDFSKKYGLDWSTQMQGYKGILAATEGSGVDKKGARQIFEGASLYGAALGIDSEKMKRGMTALTQMMSKGKVMSEELKGQLAEALPGAVQKFAASLGKSVPEMYKMMEAGKLLLISWLNLVGC
jgi:tape measure domain-containing protein